MTSPDGATDLEGKPTSDGMLMRKRGAIVSLTHLEGVSSRVSQP